MEGPDELGALDELPADEEDGRYSFIKPWISRTSGMEMMRLRRGGLTENQHGIVDEPVLNAPGLVARVAVAGHDKDHPPETDVRAVRLESTVVG